jgi:hypothetical protein
MGDDLFIEYLNERGYAPIGIPRELFDPLTLLGGLSPTTLEPYGTLADFLVPGAALPEIDRDDSAPSFANRRGSAVDANAGVSLLGSLLKLFGGNAASATAKYQQAKSYQFLFLDVKHDSVPFIRLLASLRPERVRTDTVQSVAAVPFLYVVTDTLKSSRFGVIAYDEKGAALKLDADAIKGVLGAEADVAVSAGANDVMTYSGQREPRFAFRAKRIKIGPGPAGKVTLVVDDTTQLASRFTKADEPPPDAFDLPARGVAVTIADSRSPRVVRRR